MSGDVPPAVGVVRVDGPDADVPGLREELRELWVAVTNAGGAVGFVPPVTGADVDPDLEQVLSGVRAGALTLVGLRDSDRMVAVAYLKRNDHRLMRHWAWVIKVMVDPARQGEGLGLRLMDAVADAARTERLEALRLTARAGLGLERFYEQAGYVEVGRVPGGIRVGPGEDRDDVMFWRELG